MQSSNPIYEGGAIYETMPGEAFKSLLSPSSIESPCTPHTPLAESATRYVFDVNVTAPNVPPPRKSSICQPPTLKSVEEMVPPMSVTEPAKLGDEYMIMHRPTTDEVASTPSKSAHTSSQCSE